jgi:hypothetical protein
MKLEEITEATQKPTVVKTNIFTVKDGQDDWTLVIGENRRGTFFHTLKSGGTEHVLSSVLPGKKYGSDEAEDELFGELRQTWDEVQDEQMRDRAKKLKKVLDHMTEKTWKIKQ